MLMFQLEGQQPTGNVKASYLSKPTTEGKTKRFNSITIKGKNCDCALERGERKCEREREKKIERERERREKK